LGIRSDQTIFLYQGGLSSGRGIEILIEAFSNQEGDKNGLVCMGYGPLEHSIKEKADTTATIFYHPAVMPDVLLAHTSSADDGISFVEDLCLSSRYCLPNKVFEYLLAGLPVLTSDLFEMQRLVESEKVGIVAVENTVRGFQEAVQASLRLNSSAVQAKVYSTR